MNERREADDVVEELLGVVEWDERLDGLSSVSAQLRRRLAAAEED